MSALLVALLAISAPERVGIFVGSNAGAGEREPLVYAEDDAERVRKVFVELGQIAPENAILLRGASADQILSAIRRFDAPHAMLVFYYSGHADDRALLLGATELSLVELTRALDASPSALSLRLVDACRSGALTRRKGAKLGERFSVGAEPRREGRVVITSSAEWEDSQESDRLGGSFFTIHLASALRGAADRDTDGRVTLDEAYRYVYGRTVESTLATSAGAQHPTFKHDLSGRGELVLTWTSISGGTLVIGEGSYVVIDEVTESIVAELEPTGIAADRRITLAPGRYRVKKRTSEAVWSGRVQMTAGATEIAESLLDERVAHARLVRKGGARDPGLAASVRAEAGVRGALDATVGAAPMFRVGVELALPWFSLEPRVAVTTGAEMSTPRLALSTWELNAGLSASRAIDLRWMTLRGGLLAELVRLEQTGDRAAWGGVVGFAAGVESAPLYDFVVGLSGEAAFYLYPASDAVEPPIGPGTLVTRPSYRILLGVRYEI